MAIKRAEWGAVARSVAGGMEWCRDRLGHSRAICGAIYRNAQLEKNSSPGDFSIDGVPRRSHNPPIGSDHGIINLQRETTKMAKMQIAKKTVEAEKGFVAFTFNDANAETGKAATVLVAALDGLSDAILRRLALHGLSQKVGDAYSGAESVNDAIEDASEVIETLRSDKWSERAVGEPRTSALAAALERVMKESGQPQTLDQCTEVVKNLTDEQRKGLRNMPAIKAAMSAIKAEKDAEAAKEKPLDLASIFGTPTPAPATE